MANENETKPTETTEKKESWLNKALRSVLQWLKGNWLVIIVFLLLLVVTGLIVKGCQADSEYQSLFDQYRNSIEDHRHQLEEIRTTHDREREELNRQLQEYLAEMHRIEVEYKAELVRISQIRETTRVRIIREYEEDPGTLTAAVHTTFGIPVEE